VTIAKRPSWRARDARKTASDLPVVTSERPATDWHDGQISDGEQNAVNRIPRTYIRREPPGLWLWLKRTRAVWEASGVSYVEERTFANENGKSARDQEAT